MNPNMHAVWDACAELDSLDGPRRVSDTGRLAYLLKEANRLAAIEREELGNGCGFAGGNGA